MTASRHAPRATALPTFLLLALALLIVGAPAFAPNAAHAQAAPVTTIENSGGDIVLESYDDGALLAPEASSGTGAIPADGVGVRMMWYPDKYAFRAGYVSGGQWDDSNIGFGSVAFGRNTIASGEVSIAMGTGVTASGYRSTAMGFKTTASSNYSTAMGFKTTADGDRSTAMGRNTAARGNQSTSMGQATTASGNQSTAMGYQTEASGRRSTAMGDNTTASGIESTAMGDFTTASAQDAIAMGNQTTASGQVSTTMGFLAAAESFGSFVWNDGNGYHVIPNTSDNGLSSEKTVASNSEPTGAQTFSVGATGGVRFITGPSSVTYIDGGSTGWSQTSTRSAKTDVTRADPTAVLEAVEAMPISTWEYKTESGEGAGTRHIGPMAEDFHGALPYNLGSSVDHINSLNADGVALGAVKGLARKVKRQKGKIAELEAKSRDQQSMIEEQNKRIDRLEERLAALEAEASAVPATAGLMGTPAGSWGLALLLGLGGLAGGILWRRRRS